MPISQPRRKTLGVIVNPLAGMGGRVGLKGSDGAETIAKAKRMGAKPESPQRATEALRVLARMKDQIDVFAYPMEMGENEAEEAGLSPTVLGRIKSGETTRQDTQNAAREMKNIGVDLLLFAGGDGTARDIYDVVRRAITVLGIPAGVKIHSAVYGLTPRHAGEAASSFLRDPAPNVTEGEVMDIDESSFRRGIVSARLYGYLRIPAARQHIQSGKSGGIAQEKEIIRGITSELAASMESDWVYVFGPGTTTRDILANLGLQKTLLGIDVVQKWRLIAKDANEQQLSTILRGRKSKIVVSVIGGQGYIFGRGNQQLSPAILKSIGMENVIIVATKAKLASLEGRPLLVDTGDERVDRMLSGYSRVITGLHEYVMYRVAS